MGALPGSQVRERTPEETAIFDRVIPRLLSGESSIKISRETGISADKLRMWKAREKRRRKLPATVAASSPVSIASNLETAERSIELNRFGTYQAHVAIEPLTKLRDGIGKGLGVLHDSLVAIIERCQKFLTEDRKLITVFDVRLGMPVEVLAPLELADLKNAVTLISTAHKTFADLHCLPAGAQSIDRSAQRAGPASQHVHLHSHGAKQQKAVKAVLPPVDSSVVTSSSVEVEAEVLDDLL